jgi:putative transposase
VPVRFGEEKRLCASYSIPDGPRLRVSRRRARLGNAPGVSWRLSITMEAAFSVETLEDALARHGRPEIFNTDQGSQFTGSAFTCVLASNAIAISMDGKGAWRDNVFIERLWRSVKYEEVYLRAYETVGEARNSIGRYLEFCNGRRPHSSLDGSTPDQAYFNSLPLRLAA